jgi:hypothetical protein
MPNTGLWVIYMIPGRRFRQAHTKGMVTGMKTWIKIILVSALALMLLEPIALAAGTTQENTTEGNSRAYGEYQNANVTSGYISLNSPIPGTWRSITAGDDILHATPALVSGPSVSGVPIFPPDHIWNTRVDSLPVDSRSAAYVGTIGSNAYLHADFGSGLYEGNPIGIPYNIVNGSQGKKTVLFDYADESDPGPYPIPDNPFIEGGSDRHMVIIDRDTRILYELFAAEKQGDGSWTAGSGAVFNLSGYTLRPSGWTSADAAGLAILPGLVRFDEVSAGEITHALRFTAPSTRRAYVWPARHYASSITDTAYPPMGQRFRLKASFNTSGYPSQAQIVLEALKKYGMILSDNGAPWYITGAPDEQWNNDALHTLHQLRGSDFEAVDSSSLMIDQDSGQARVASVVSNSSRQTGVFRQGAWYLDYNTDGVADRTFPFGKSGDIPIVGDWDSNGISDAGVFRPANGNWYLDTTRTGVVTTTFRFGKTGDVPATGDWDGDVSTDIGVFRPSSGMWYLDSTKTGGVNWTFPFGKTGDVPVVGDWDGNGISDAGIFRPANGYWYLDTTRTGVVNTTFRFGKTGDIPVTGDWDGDGSSDAGIFRPATGTWYLNYHKDSVADDTFPFGLSGDLPEVGKWI